MVLLFGACNSDELAEASDTRNTANTDSDSNTNSNTNTDSNNTPGSNSQTDSDSNNSLPTDGMSASETADTSNSNATPGDSESNTVPSTPVDSESQGTETESDSDPTEGNSNTDTDGDTEGVCEAPKDEPGNECATCLYENCTDEYCVCGPKCLCVVDCLELVSDSGSGKGLDDLLSLDLDDLVGGLLDVLLGDLLGGLNDGDFDELGDVLECLTQEPCGVPLDQIGGLNLDLEDLLNLEDILNGDNIKGVLEDILEVTGNSVAPLLTCAELTNPNGKCGTLCPITESLLD